MAVQADKRHAYWLIEADRPDWGDDRIAAILGVSVRTLRRWRAELRAVATQVRADARSCRLSLASAHD